MTDRLLIYGANGATGRRLAELALADGLTPVLAGRDADRITRLADRLGGEARVAPIDQLAGIVTDVRVIASCV
ncbi:MAG TPA: saccharopine dehydrogenase, partial [Pseudonocardia sp.]